MPLGGARCGYNSNWCASSYSGGRGVALVRMGVTLAKAGMYTCL